MVEGIFSQTEMDGLFSRIRSQLDENPSILSSFNTFMGFDKNASLDSLKDFITSWYTGNYDPSTKKHTLYRFVDSYPGFDEIKKGASDIVPEGYVNFGSEANLISELNKMGLNNYSDVITNPSNANLIDFFNNDYAYSDVKSSNKNLDPFTYWTTNFNHWANDRDFLIKVELDPADVFRWGGDSTDKKIFDNLYEQIWITVGPVKKESIKEIISLY